MYKYILKNKKIYLQYILLTVLTSVLNILYAFFLSEIINAATEFNKQKLVWLLVIGVFYICTIILLTRGYGLVRNELSTIAITELKKDIFDKVIRQNIKKFNEENKAVYTDELVSQVPLLNNLYFKNVIEIPQMVLSLGLAIFACLTTAPVMLLVMIFFGVLAACVSKKMSTIVDTNTNQYSEKMKEYTGCVSDYFQMQSVILSFDVTKTVMEKHATKCHEMGDATKKMENSRVNYGCSINFCGLMATMIIMVISSYLAVSNIITIGMVIGMGQLTGYIISPIMSASEIVVSLKSARKIIEKLQDKMNLHEEYKGDKDIHDINEIDIRNLSYSYGDKKILNDFSAKFEAGKKYLIKGKNGSGKSTLLKILDGLFVDYSGEVLVDGMQITDISRSSISKYISMISSEITFFNGSIRDNITLFEDYPQEKVNQVISKCRLNDFIASLPDGLKTVIYDNGVNLSSGERRKIAIARALIKNTKVLLLDEITSNLDVDSLRDIKNIILSIEDKMIVCVDHLENDDAEIFDQKIMLGDC